MNDLDSIASHAERLSERVRSVHDMGTDAWRLAEMFELPFDVIPPTLTENAEIGTHESTVVPRLKDQVNELRRALEEERAKNRQSVHEKINGDREKGSDAVWASELREMQSELDRARTLVSRETERANLLESRLEEEQTRCMQLEDAYRASASAAIAFDHAAQEAEMTVARLCRPTPAVGDAVEVRSPWSDGAGDVSWRPATVTRVSESDPPQLEVEYHTGRVEGDVNMDRVLLMVDHIADDALRTHRSGRKKRNERPYESQLEFIRESRWRSSSASFDPSHASTRSLQEQVLEARWIAAVLARRSKKLATANVTLKSQLETIRSAVQERAKEDQEQNEEEGA